MNVILIFLGIVASILFGFSLGVEGEHDKRDRKEFKYGALGGMWICLLLIFGYWVMRALHIWVE